MEAFGGHGVCRPVTVPVGAGIGMKAFEGQHGSGHSLPSWRSKTCMQRSQTRAKRS